jgi:hypothetical protein
MVNKQSARLFRSFRRLARGARMRRFSRMKARLYAVRVRNDVTSRASCLVHSKASSSRWSSPSFAAVIGSARRSGFPNASISDRCAANPKPLRPCSWVLTLNRLLKKRTLRV